MAVVADRVIVELEAKLDRYTANVRQAEQRFNSATQNIQRNARQMEASITRSSGAAGGAIRNLAATFAAAFSVRQIQQMADSYTRFTNQLAVAGVEGDNLARVQKELFAIAQQNGVELEAVGTLYSRAAQNQRELGATTSDILDLTRAVSASLKISGTSATQASGALLQLGQALGSPRVQAEEFNSLLDAMQPLLREASKNIEGTGGTLSGLTRKIKDVKGEGVSNIELFRGITAALGELEAKAGTATLTIGGAFTVLNNALGLYIGQTDDALSATERISQAIITLSENLDTVTAALGVLGAVMLGRYVAGMVAASAATGITGTAIFALQARAIGAATTMEALALTSRAAGASMLAAFGGPVGLAVAALAVGVYYLATRTEEGAQASAQYAQQQTILGDITNKTTDAIERVTVSTGKARAEAIANAKALRQQTIQYLATARAALIAAAAQARQARTDAAVNVQRATQSTVGAGSGYDPAVGAIRRGNKATSQADADLRAATANVVSATNDLNRLNGLINSPPAYVAPPVVDSGGGKPKKAPKGPKEPKGPKGPDPDDIARRFEDDLARGQVEYEMAQAELIGTFEARAIAERTRIRTDQASNERAIKADDDYSAAQKARLIELNNQIADARMEAQLAAQREQEAAESLALAQAGIENERDLLQKQGRLTETTGQRRNTELRLLELQYQEERLRLEAIANNERLNETEREIARRRLAALGDMEAADRASVERENEGPGQRYRRELNSKDINDQLDEVRVRGLQSLEDKLVDVTSKIFKMGGAFGEVANSIISDLLRIGIQRAIIGPLADAIFGPAAGGAPPGFGGSGSGGLLGSVINGLGSVIRGGRASGGHVSPGGVYPVNEGGKIEGFQPAGSGKIVPLGRLPSAGGGGTVVQQTFVLDARYGVTTPELLRHVNKVASQAAGQAGAMAFDASQRAVPGRIERMNKLGT